MSTDIIKMNEEAMKKLEEIRRKYEEESKIRMEKLRKERER